MVIKKIRKRDGRFVEFDKDKIAKAIYRAAYAVGGKDKDRADYLATLAFEKVNKSFKTRVALNEKNSSVKRQQFYRI